MKYYEKLIDELYPAGVPLDRNLIESYNSEELVIEISDELMRLYLCSRKLAFEAKRGVKEIIVQSLQKTLDKFVNEENATPDIQGFIIEVARNTTWSHFATEWRIEAAQALLQLFWMECRRELADLKPTEKPPMYGIGIRRKTDNTIWLIYTKKPEERQSE